MYYTHKHRGTQSHTNRHNIYIAKTKVVTCVHVIHSMQNHEPPTESTISTLRPTVCIMRRTLAAYILRSLAILYCIGQMEVRILQTAKKN